ncbi:hypothetical protein [Microbacterium sp.]|uniref:hypothetical protein n=1 Tax=Microbacterium sp. TaxID=51671 RepID=UPI002FE112F5
MEPLEGKGSAFADALRAAIAVRGITLARLQSQLVADGNPVSVATLSYWRSGDRQPEGALSLGVVEGLEDRLGLVRGHLASLLGPSTRLGPVAPPRLPFEGEREQRELNETIEALRSAPQESLRDLCTHMMVSVGEGGAVERVVTRSLIQSTKGSISELPLIDMSPEEADVVPIISDVIGGRIDREYLHPGRMLSGAVIVLDEPISTGETAMIEYAETFPPGCPPRRSVWHATSRAAREVVIWVRFDLDHAPRWCEEYVESDAGDSVVVRAVKAGSVHAFRHGFGPGILGIRWGDAR